MAIKRATRWSQWNHRPVDETERSAIPGALAIEGHYAGALDLAELKTMMFDGLAECADGCIVEPDGICPHGYHSPLITLGLI